MRHDIAFLHTAPEHVVTFGALMSALAPELAVRHEVDESLLAQARAAGGIGPDLEARIGRAMLGAASSGARVVVCTCSTIGGVAERAGQGNDLTTQRIDRAMADAAVAMGPKILIVAALSSTVGPTRALIRSSASRLARSVVTEEVVIADAWPYFEQSLPGAYYQHIAAAIKANAKQADVIVLAQASMAGAVALCPDVQAPILASPRLGTEAAIAAFYADRP